MVESCSLVYAWNQNYNGESAGTRMLQFVALIGIQTGMTMFVCCGWVEFESLRRVTFRVDRRKGSVAACCLHLYRKSLSRSVLIVFIQVFTRVFCC